MFHGVRDIRQLRSLTFLRLAVRISAYGGAVAMRMAAERDAPAEAPAAQRSRYTPRRTAPARPVTPRNAGDVLPVASAAQLRHVLGKVPGVEMWADVREVKPDGG